MKKILLLSAVMMLSVACEQAPKDESAALVGTWDLTEISTSLAGGELERRDDLIHGEHYVFNRDATGVARIYFDEVLRDYDFTWEWLKDRKLALTGEWPVYSTKGPITTKSTSTSTIEDITTTKLVLSKMEALPIMNDDDPKERYWRYTFAKVE